MRGGDGGQYQLFDLLRSYGAFDIESGTVALNPERAKEALTFYAELMTAHQAVPQSAPNDSFRQIMEGFKTGQTGMLWHHTGSAIDLTGTLSEDQIGTMIVPAGPAQHVAPVTYVFNSLTGGRGRRERVGVDLVLGPARGGAGPARRHGLRPGFQRGRAGPAHPGRAPLRSGHRDARDRHGSGPSWRAWTGDEVRPAARVPEAAGRQLRRGRGWSPGSSASSTARSAKP